MEKLLSTLVVFVTRVSQAPGDNDFPARSIYGSFLTLTNFSIQTRTKLMVTAAAVVRKYSDRVRAILFSSCSPRGAVGVRRRSPSSPKGRAFWRFPSGLGRGNAEQ